MVTDLLKISVPLFQSGYQYEYSLLLWYTPIPILRTDTTRTYLLYEVG